ncbi:hypothetical protein SDC9_134686 [bioreactor metagenome]|uniref:Uncharacterized protein n=1 Tax=bioreactor metagenome TaxID=1076179 RepID=A0A645DDZ1_9ZZZZ
MANSPFHRLVAFDVFERDGFSSILDHLDDAFARHSIGDNPVFDFVCFTRTPVRIVPAQLGSQVLAIVIHCQRIDLLKRLSGDPVGRNGGIDFYLVAIDLGPDTEINLPGRILELKHRADGDSAGNSFGGHFD